MRQFSSLPDLLQHGHDTVIDVRSPAEFAEDHVPGAINLPSLSDDERAEVGTCYKQVSPFMARKMGAAMVARNVARHLDGPLSDKPGDWHPLLYCWRGGQRSGAFATILSQIGWRTELVAGGYQSYRRLVHDALYLQPLPHRIVLLDGNTGTAKTALLHRLADRGLQTIDLEGLAGHRGSLLGATQDGQPSQKAFETGLAASLTKLDPDRITLVEAESSKVGQINLPKQLWTNMIAAPRIVIDAPIAARATYLTQAYNDVIADPVDLAERLAPLRRIRGNDVVDTWMTLLAAGDMTGLATALMRDHYDPAYTRSRHTRQLSILANVTAAHLDNDGLNRVADDIAGAIRIHE